MPLATRFALILRRPAATLANLCPWTADCAVLACFVTTSAFIFQAKSISSNFAVPYKFYLNNSTYMFFFSCRRFGGIRHPIRKTNQCKIKNK